jgi:methylated-DNA-[protein]-cysteine S-methyltransferase
MVVGQLNEYFEGTRRRFELELDPSGTDFQQLVWAEVSLIPYGGTRSYGAVARRLGKPTAVRAVGTANGANPIPIVIPCHRVVGADGSLVGYGGGLDVKAALLEHEGVRLPTDAQLRFAFE